MTEQVSQLYSKTLEQMNEDISFKSYYLHSNNIFTEVIKQNNTVIETTRKLIEDLQKKIEEHKKLIENSQEINLSLNRENEMIIKKTKNLPDNVINIEETINYLTKYISMAQLDPSVFDNTLLEYIQRYIDYKRTEYDCIFCILCYETVEHINFLIDNIEKYNKNIKYLIVIHGSDDVFQSRYKLTTKNVVICPFHFNKQRYNSSLLLGQMDCIRFSRNFGFKCRAYHFLSSSCLFVKQQLKESYIFSPEELEPVNIREKKSLESCIKDNMEKIKLLSDRTNNKGRLLQVLDEQNVFAYYRFTVFNTRIYPDIVTHKVSDFFEKYMRQYLINLQPIEQFAYEEVFLETLHAFCWKNQQGIMKSQVRNSSCMNCRGENGEPLIMEWVKDCALSGRAGTIKLSYEGHKPRSERRIDHYEVMRYLAEVENYDSEAEAKVRAEAKKRVTEKLAEIKKKQEEKKKEE